MGLGFVFVLLALGSIREILGSATLFNMQVLGDWFNPWMIMILPPGAFLTLGLLIGLGNWLNERKVKI